MLDDARAFSSFPVADLAEAERFYRDVLGLRCTHPPGYEGSVARLHAGGDHEVLLYEMGAAHRPAGFAVLNFGVGDLDGVVERLRAHGVSLERYEELAQDERGIHDTGRFRIGWFTDPSGNVLAVVEDSP